MTHHTGVRLAEDGFLIAGIRLASTRIQRFRSLHTGVTSGRQVESR